MKKIVTALSMVVVLLLGGCGSSMNPETILEKAYENMQKLDSFTLIGDMNMSVGGEDDSELAIPINMEIRTIRHDLDNPNDDEGYAKVSLSLLGESLTTQTWSKDGMNYIDTGDGKYYKEEKPVTATTQDAKALAKALMEACEEVNVTQDNEKTILDLRLKEGKLPNLMGFAGVDNVEGLDMVGNDALEGFKVNHLYMALSKDNYIDSLKLEGTSEADGMKMLIDMTMDIFDRNSAVIPSFNPSEFVSEEEYNSNLGYGNVADEAEDLNLVPYDEIEFDTGESIAIDGAGKTATYYPVYFDEDGELRYVDKDYNVCAYGYFMHKEVVDDIMNEVKGSSNYTNVQEGKKNGYQTVIAYAEKETDLFTEDTPFIAYSFDDTTLGLILVGLQNYEDLESLLNNTVYTVK